jgi:Acyl-CoA carboxylase epsilon subunit
VEFRIERGVPTDEELAAIVGVLLARSASPVLTAEAVSRWAASARPGTTRPDGRPSRPGRDGWRSSGLPR